LHDWNPGLAYTVDEIVEAFGLNLSGLGYGTSRREVHSSIRAKHVGHTVSSEIDDDPIYLKLKDKGFFGSPERISDKGEDSIWVDMQCPWIDEHTAKVNSGTAYRIGGGFKCHHGHCMDKGIRQVIEKLDIEDMMPALE